MRPLRFDGNFAYVPLTRGYEAIIDASDATLIGGLLWNARPDWNTVYARRTDYSGEMQKTIFMHRFLVNCPAGMEVDHIDGNGLNNSRSNLRIATKSQNQQNSSRGSTHRGATFIKSLGKWQAQIGLNGTTHYLGLFVTAEDAHAAYAAASAKLHGEFGRTE